MDKNFDIQVASREILVLFESLIFFWIWIWLSEQMDAVQELCRPSVSS